MMFVEPTPCGRQMFGSMLVIVESQPILLTAARDLPTHMPLNAHQVLDQLARDLIAEIRSNASLCGLTTEQINAAMREIPELSFEKKQRT